MLDGIDDLVSALIGEITVDYQQGVDSTWYIETQREDNIDDALIGLPHKNTATGGKSRASR